MSGQERTGAVVSCTTTLKVHIVLFPEASVAVQVTCVLPNGKNPEGEVQLTLGAGSQRSVADIGRTTIAPPGSLPSTSRDVQAIAGPVLSTTVIMNVQDASFPAPSLATQVTGVVPSGKVLPEGGMQVTCGEGSQSSVAVGVVKVTVAPPGPVPSTSVMSAGRAIWGG